MDEAFPWIDRSELPILEAALARMCGEGGVLSRRAGSGGAEMISLVSGGAEQLLFLAGLVWPMIDTYWVALVACNEMRPADIEATFAAEQQQRRAGQAQARAQRSGARRAASVAAAPAAAAAAAKAPLKTRLLRRAERLYHASALEHFESCSNETFDQAVSRLTEVDVLSKQKLLGEKVVAPAYVEEGRLDRLAAEVFRFRLLPAPAAVPTEPTPAKL